MTGLMSAHETFQQAMHIEIREEVCMLHGLRERVAFKLNAGKIRIGSTVRVAGGAVSKPSPSTSTPAGSSPVLAVSRGWSLLLVLVLLRQFFLRVFQEVVSLQPRNSEKMS